MLMVIFGAGASYDSCPTYPPGSVAFDEVGLGKLDAYGRPPLACELFANRPLFIKALGQFPQCKTIVNRFRHPEVLSGKRPMPA
jgi:hypothetical protein